MNTPLLATTVLGLVYSKCCFVRSITEASLCPLPLFPYLPLVWWYNTTHSVRFSVALDGRYVADRVHELLGGGVVGWNVDDLTRI